MATGFGMGLFGVAMAPESVVIGTVMGAAGGGWAGATAGQIAGTGGGAIGGTAGQITGTAGGVIGGTAVVAVGACTGAVVVTAGTIAGATIIPLARAGAEVRNELKAAATLGGEVRDKAGAKYKFGDVTRGFLARGKVVRGAKVDAKYKVGDLTRGFFGRVYKDNQSDPLEWPE